MLKAIALINTTGIVLLAAAPIEPWVQLGGIGVLGFLLFIVLTRTIPKTVETHKEIMDRQASVVEGLAQRQETTGMRIEEVINRSTDRQIGTIEKMAQHLQAPKCPLIKESPKEEAEGRDG